MRGKLPEEEFWMLKKVKKELVALRAISMR
jgi:hypothetical protein